MFAKLAPRIFPIEIRGLFVIIEAIAIKISGIEVMAPRTIKEIKYSFIPMTLESFIKDLATIPLDIPRIMRDIINTKI